MARTPEELGFDPSKLEWRRSSTPNLSDNQVEIARLPNGKFAMRQTDAPNGPYLVFSQSEYAAFIAGALDGEFDLPQPHA